MAVTWRAGVLQRIEYFAEIDAWGFAFIWLSLVVEQLHAAYEQRFVSYLFQIHAIHVCGVYDPKKWSYILSRNSGERSFQSASGRTESMPQYGQRAVSGLLPGSVIVSSTSEAGKTLQQ